MGIEFWVYSCTPEGDVIAVSEDLLKMLHTLTGSDDANEMGAGGQAASDECLVSQFHALAGGQHRIDEQQGAAVQVGGCDVLDMYIHLAALLILVIAVGGDKGVVSPVEDIQEACVKRQSGTEYCAYDQLIVESGGFGGTERRLHLFLAVIEGFADFVGNHFADTLQIAAEAHTVVLDANVAQFGDIAVDHGVRGAEID